MPRVSDSAIEVFERGLINDAISRGLIQFIDCYELETLPKSVLEYVANILPEEMWRKLSESKRAAEEADDSDFEEAKAELLSAKLEMLSTNSDARLEAAEASYHKALMKHLKEDDNITDETIRDWLKMFTLDETIAKLKIDPLHPAQYDINAENLRISQDFFNLAVKTFLIRYFKQKHLNEELQVGDEFVARSNLSDDDGATSEIQSEQESLLAEPRPPIDPLYDEFEKETAKFVDLWDIGVNLRDVYAKTTMNERLGAELRWAFVTSCNNAVKNMNDETLCNWVDVCRTIYNRHLAELLHDSNGVATRKLSELSDDEQMFLSQLELLYSFALRDFFRRCQKSPSEILLGQNETATTTTSTTTTTCVDYWREKPCAVNWRNATERDINNRQAKRLRTFFSWKGIPSGNELAASGFFHLYNRTETADAVQCEYCDLVLFSWTDDDIPPVEHFNHSPECPYAKHAIELYKLNKL